MIQAKDARRTFTLEQLIATFEHAARPEAREVLRRLCFMRRATRGPSKGFGRSRIGVIGG